MSARLVVTTLAVLAVAALGGATLAQHAEEEGRSLTLPGSGREVPLYDVGDDVFVLEDRDWCENLIALTEEQDSLGGFLPADPDRTELCAAFLERLALNEISLLPLSLAQQVLELPEELVLGGAPPSLNPGVAAEEASGSGESRSKSFTIVAGDYDAVVRTNLDCEFFAAFLTESDGEAPVTDIVATGSIGYVEAGDYYWDVLAPGCDWGIELRSSP